MKFECGDLDRALAHPDLMTEARAHMTTCAACRREFELWREISSIAPQLHQEWDTPELWPRIHECLQAERKQAPIPFWRNWKSWAAAAALLIAATSTWLLFQRHQPAVSFQDRDFLTEQALVEVEKTEAAYRASIDRLTRLAEPKLQNSDSPVIVNTREKLVMLDAAIADTRGNVDSNRFNLHLQTTLAELYREKQETLKELLTNAKEN